MTIRIKREIDVYLAMNESEKLAKTIGFDNAITLKIKTTVSELAHNILKYATKGSITLTPFLGYRKGIEIFSRDTGPGIKDVEEALSDNFSSSGTLGLGLPGIKRMMDEFEIDTEHNQGTRIKVRKWIK
jgi:serine/threonine-protein kinase RsbT